MKYFVSKNIISRFGIPKKIITNHDTQFDCKNFKMFCKLYGIQKAFSTPIRPQAFGLAEIVNKRVIHWLKTRLGEHKGSWVDELHGVLWAYRTSKQSYKGEHPFLLGIRRQGNGTGQHQYQHSNLRELLLRGK